MKNLDSMMMANLPPVMLPPITDYGMLTPTLGIKVSRFTLPAGIGEGKTKEKKKLKFRDNAIIQSQDVISIRDLKRGEI